MSRLRADRVLLLCAGLALSLVAPACGKKAPLRLPGDRPVEEAAAPRARVREGSVTLDFHVPRHRLFPEREAPWVLARVLRQTGGAAGAAVEAGALLEAGGFAFGSPLSWTDREQPPGEYSYRVEFRDAERRRRALTAPVSVAWKRVPGMPLGLVATGGTRSVALSWSAPEDADPGLRFRIYRRQPPAVDAAPAVPEPVADPRFVDSRVEPGREYCYAVRAVLELQGVAIEGPAGPEACAGALLEPPAPSRPPGAP